MLKTLFYIVKSMRPPQWIKNGIVFAPLIFSKHFNRSDEIITSITVFIGFCLVSSAVYLFNDLLDSKADRLHPVKKNRPIASGMLKVNTARLAAIVFALGGVAICYSINAATAIFAGAYLLLNLMYSMILKHLVIIDVMTIAAGFVLRIFAGGFAINVHISFWLLVCTVLLALFLGFGKRRHELSVVSGGEDGHRKILSEYSTYFLDQMISVAASSTVIGYSLYTLDPAVHASLGTDNLPATVPFVIYGIFRYLYLVHQKEEGGSPTRLFYTDKPLLIAIMLWVATVFIILGL